MNGNAESDSDKKLFFYCLYHDAYTEALIIRAIQKNIDKFPAARHVVYPIYGTRHYSSLKSKYPKFIKYLYLLAKFLAKEFRTEHIADSKLKSLLPLTTYKKIELVSANSFIMHLITSFLYFHKKFSVAPKNEKSFIDNFTLKSVKSGDLAVDTYLRFKAVPKVNINHWFFRDIVWRAFAIEKLCLGYFKKNFQCFLFGAYSTYINHGIPLRVACRLRQNVSITFASPLHNYVIHKDLKSTILPTYVGYHDQYNKSAAQALPINIIDKANQSLQSRIESKYDESMAYMSRTKGVISSLADINVSAKDKLILSLHDFFDSPHVYQWMIFPDFWSWATSTLDYCSEHNINILVKSHPNQLPENKRVINTLSKMYSKQKNIEWLPTSIKNSSIFKDKPSAVISVHGSITAEAAFCNIPVLLAGDFPGVNFSIANIARTQSEYFDYLGGRKKLSSGSKEDAILFIAYHNRDNLLQNTSGTIRSKAFDLDQANQNASGFLKNKDIARLIDELLDNLFEDIY